MAKVDFRIFVSILFHLIQFKWTVNGTVTGVALKGPEIADLGNEVTYTCSATCGGVGCSYAITEGSQKQAISMSNNSTAIAKWNIKTRQPTSLIKCEVTDPHNNKQSDSKTLNIYYKSEVNFSLTANTFRCTADGNPNNYTYTWKQIVNGFEVIRQQNQTGLREYVWTVSETYVSQGNYACCVKNGHFEEVKEVINNVRFKDKPLLVNFPQDGLNVSKGSSVTTLFDIYAYPTLSSEKVSVTNASGVNIAEHLLISYTTTEIKVNFHFKNLVPIQGTRVNVTFPIVTEEMFGVNNFTFQNSEGCRTVNIAIHPQGLPDVPLDVYIDHAATTLNSLTVRLTAGFYNGGNQTLYVEYRQSSSETWTPGPSSEVGSESYVQLHLTIKGLEPDTRYFLKAYAKNQYGASNFTTLSTFTSKEPLSPWLIGGIVICVLLVIIVPIVICIGCKRKRKSQNASLNNTGSALNYENNTFEPRVATNVNDEMICETSVTENYVNLTFSQADPYVREPEVAPGETLPLYFDLSAGSQSPLEENYANVSDNTQMLVSRAHSKEAEDLYLDLDVKSGNSAGTQQNKDFRPQASSFSGRTDASRNQNTAGGHLYLSPPDQTEELYLDLNVKSASTMGIQQSKDIRPTAGSWSGRTGASRNQNIAGGQHDLDPRDKAEELYLNLNVQSGISTGILQKNDFRPKASSMSGTTNASGNPSMSGSPTSPKQEDSGDVVGEAYENLEQYKKTKPQPSRSESNRFLRDSIPTQQAPPPPAHLMSQAKPKESYYMN